jgi:hypothetical protein
MWPSALHETGSSSVSDLMQITLRRADTLTDLDACGDEEVRKLIVDGLRRAPYLFLPWH